jgi:hypothetical protein
MANRSDHYTYCLVSEGVVAPTIKHSGIGGGSVTFKITFTIDTNLL